MSKLITDDCITSFITNHLGKTDISTIGDGTITGAISTINKRVGNYDWSTYGTADTTSTSMPVINGSKVYHRDVAATLSQASYWSENTSENSYYTCLKLSNNLVIYFFKGNNSYDITTAGIKGYYSKENIITIPSTVSRILYVNAYVQNNQDWENVVMRIHSCTTTQLKNHFWCLNSYKGIALYWNVMLVAQI